MIEVLDLPHRQARELAQQAPIYLPVNPVEYHGPHLSLHNDSVCSHGLIRDLHRRLTPDQPLLVARDLEVGVDPCPGPGTRHTPYRQAKRAIVQACEGLVQLGARQVVLVTFHGSPLHSAAIDHGVRALKRRGVRAAAPFNVVLHTLLTADGSAYADSVAHLPTDVRETLIEWLPQDFHAGFFETSVALHYAPETVGERPQMACPDLQPFGPLRAAAKVARSAGAARLATELDFAAYGLAWYRLRPFPGYTSHPAHADATAGAWFAKRIIDDMEAPTRAALSGEGQTPPPIMKWLRWLTLGGRLPGPGVPLDAIEARVERGSGEPRS